MSQIAEIPTARKPRSTPVTATVTAVRRLTPHMVRVTLGGDALAAVDPGPFTDRYIKIVLGPPPAPGARPLVRTYTIRRVHDEGWDVDVVEHGEGYGGPWAGRVRPGEEVSFLGPGGDYAPSADATWHLLVGDESALPAIAAACETLPRSARAHVFIEVAGPEEQQELVSDGDLHVTWVYRDRGLGLFHTVRTAHESGGLPAGVPHAFLHGEAGCVRDLRRWARAELGVPRELLSASGYWKKGRDDEGWRAEKPAWRAAIEQDDAALAG
ncbi:siderophore-interacting protein [Myceligenerans pegani]|uniref:Siderophore-interacting protein n=1 Tax=Myceligenerans pegani TaxID=2776917 RepID=A0ABR9N0D6_9MICO|nr:siderophore-interacting protein [Myceligenerans sp. TRM 65318]MBE1877111.1 siderophore-interacting protein [Myceligenerans sp. TRM 65318]MBE3019382.1 siderophore-interacting protein [Myceligenerans sp. TRM 65318]